jgi:magnesium transporter
MLNEIKNAKDIIVWIDLLQPTEKDVLDIKKNYAIEVPSKKALAEFSHIKYKNKILFLSLPHIISMNTEDPSSPLCFILKNKILITVRYIDLPAFERAKKEIEKQNIQNSFDSFTVIIDHIIKLGANKLEKIQALTTVLSKDIFFQAKDHSKNITKINKHFRYHLHRLGRYGEKTSQIRDIQLGLQRIISYILQTAAQELEHETKKNLESLTKELEFLASFEREHYQFLAPFFTMNLLIPGKNFIKSSII